FANARSVIRMYRAGPRKKRDTALMGVGERRDDPSGGIVPSVVIRGPVDAAIYREVWDLDAYGLRDLSPAPKTVLDIGAHTGAFTLRVAASWPEARIVACEADPENAALLRRHVASVTNAIVVEAAIVGEELQEVTFRMVADKGGGNSGG